MAELQMPGGDLNSLEATSRQRPPQKPTHKQQRKCKQILKATQWDDHGGVSAYMNYPKLHLPGFPHSVRKGSSQIEEMPRSNWCSYQSLSNHLNNIFSRKQASVASGSLLLRVICSSFTHTFWRIKDKRVNSNTVIWQMHISNQELGP